MYEFPNVNPYPNANPNPNRYPNQGNYIEEVIDGDRVLLGTDSPKFDKVGNTLKSSIDVVLQQGLLKLISLGCQFMLLLAQWAGGQRLKASYVLFGTTALCLVLRRGVFSFFGMLIGLRVIRTSWFSERKSDKRRDSDLNVTLDIGMEHTKKKRD